MKNKKRTFITAISAVLLVALTIAGTLAYLTATTDQVKNTFTVGKVVLANEYNHGLDEATVDEYGVAASGENRVLANAYKLIPGHTYTKDPTIHVAAGSEPASVFVRVENGLVAIEADTKIAAQMTTNNWTLVSGYTDLWKYNAVVDARTSKQDLIVFENFKIAENANVANYTNAEIIVKAFAIQSANITDAAALTEAIEKLGGTAVTP